MAIKVRNENIKKFALQISNIQTKICVKNS